jgi:hypothetical protein
LNSTNNFRISLAVQPISAIPRGLSRAQNNHRRITLHE